MKTTGWLLPVLLMLTGCTTFDTRQNHGLKLSQALTSIGAAPALAGASMGMMDVTLPTTRTTIPSLAGLVIGK